MVGPAQMGPIFGVRWVSSILGRCLIFLITLLQQNRKGSKIPNPCGSVPACAECQSPESERIGRPWTVLIDNLLDFTSRSRDLLRRRLLASRKTNLAGITRALVHQKKCDVGPPLPSSQRD